ncbi:hypothetical protein MTR62_12000 [Novosphingobium sp. 1949]|uniref:Uncharacterized protein n=1 Tax=Novosphingobium organovorum TaxID=2930092 RepID=A0ABT0BED5_9SPHN|nr:hypothetical protein [Novosphingobium organovorum]MCJ2183407.1 hypothetical protein [Novosphingobium organovorum]
MAIRFAAARGRAFPLLAKVQCVSAPLGGANDNADRKCRAGSIDLTIVTRAPGTAATTPLPRHPEAAPASDGTSEAASNLLTATLYHFARHGLSAAEHARTNAQVAQLEGDSRSCSWWISICRQLDRRMADQFERHLVGRR